MATVELRDIVTDADREGVLALPRGPGQERYLGSMESHFEDAIEDARANPRMWSVHDGDQVVGFAMISDDIPAERLAADDDIVGPYFLWRLLIDARIRVGGTAAPPSTRSSRTCGPSRTPSSC
jgi:diamine N-acetyltransferase